MKTMRKEKNDGYINVSFQLKPRCLHKRKLLYIGEKNSSKVKTYCYECKKNPTILLSYV